MSYRQSIDMPAPPRKASALSQHLVQHAVPFQFVLHKTVPLHLPENAAFYADSAGLSLESVFDGGGKVTADKLDAISINPTA